ncbi:hypothetical protein V5J73_05420 [Flavobacterium sp. KS-LB2]|jgi:hypothetical protein|uniref:hypothetical protein n=1 Tax=Flavobacterium sp. KS-LB2 TaxID=3120525 RepID=UPI0030D21EC6
MSIFENPNYISLFNIKAQESSYWNGRAYMSSEKYSMSFATPRSESTIYFEARNNEATRVGIDGFTDQNILSSETKIRNPHYKTSFRIGSASFLHKIMGKNKAFDISCNDEKLKTVLASSSTLKQIFEIANSSSDLSPDILAEYDRNDNSYVLKINYLTKEKNEQLILLAIDFLTETSEKI